MRRRYRDDPHWTTAREQAGCSLCGCTIRPGDRMFYYPSVRGSYCVDHGCAAAAERDWLDHRADEDGY